MRYKVEDLTSGDLVDLEGDPYADPDGDDPLLEFELVEVAGVFTGPAEVLVTFSDFSLVSFPRGHYLKVNYRTGLISEEKEKELSW